MLGSSTVGALLVTPDMVCVGGPGNAGSGSGKKQLGTSSFFNFPLSMDFLISSSISFT